MQGQATALFPIAEMPKHANDANSRTHHARRSIPRMPEVMISGPEGRLEARYHHSRLPNAPIALLLHPHPLFGGTMNNKVVYSAFRLFRGKNFSTLRLNFRGVGRSQGAFDRGEGELSDAASCLDWLQSYNPNATSCWIVGVSFGSWIGMQLLMRRPEISRFISIAPPADKFRFHLFGAMPDLGIGAARRPGRDCGGGIGRPIGAAVVEAKGYHHRLSAHRRRKSPVSGSAGRS